MTHVITDAERALLAKRAWTLDELITIALLAQRWAVTELISAPGPDGSNYEVAP